MIRDCLIYLALLLPACAHSPKPTTSKVVETTYYNSVYIEIAYIGTAQPSNAVLKYFEAQIKEAKIAKKVKFLLCPTKTLPPVPWNHGLLNLFERTNRMFVDNDPDDFELFLFVAYLPGPFIEGDYNNLAGLAYGDTSFAIFHDVLDDKEEGHVLVHELGHLLEFVDVKARGEKKHANPDRPRHCNNEACTMYWRVNSKQTGIDKACLEQLRAKIRARRKRPVKAKRIGPL